MAAVHTVLLIHETSAAGDIHEASLRGGGAGPGKVLDPRPPILSRCPFAFPWTPQFFFHARKQTKWG